MGPIHSNIPGVETVSAMVAPLHPGPVVQVTVMYALRINSASKPVAKTAKPA